MESKMYYVELPHANVDIERAEEIVTDYLTGSSCNDKEVPNTPETIGRFTLDNMGKSDAIRALYVEVEDIGVVETFVISGDKLRHYIMPEYFEKKGA